MAREEAEEEVLNLLALLVQKYTNTDTQDWAREAGQESGGRSDSEAAGSSRYSLCLLY